MAYVPNDEWASDTTITAEKLNHMQTQYAEIISYLEEHDHDNRYYPKAEMDSYFWSIDTDGSGSGMDCDTLDGVDASAIAGGVEPGIVIWYWGPMSDFTGKLLTADNTWHIADGTDGTIDLTDYFVVGAGGSYSVGQELGNATFKPAGTVTIASHVLTVTESMHTHSMTDYYPTKKEQGVGSHCCSSYTVAPTLSGNASTTGYNGGGQGHTHPGSFAGSSSSLLPPYVALIPIQKMES